MNYEQLLAYIFFGLWIFCTVSVSWFFTYLLLSDKNVLDIKPYHRPMAFYALIYPIYMALVLLITNIIERF